jgi:hypothetical protein
MSCSSLFQSNSWSVSTQKIYSILLEIRLSLPVDTRWTFFQAPYAFEDALGYRYPIPSEYDFESIQNIIKYRLRQSPAYREVVLGNYELFNTQNPKQVMSAHMLTPPGTAITMAILLNKPNIPSDYCPMPHCRSDETQPVKGGGRNWLVYTAYLYLTNLIYLL